MAPSRKRKAAAAVAAAAKRQWKAGDLVLAKVKGFPAWPATVSEPEKWGYRPDMKKVLVYFFGTQQIAFCNPVDVEAFTEEKRQSLLGRRQGKGADFVRAVQEIIDTFEKAKKQECSSDVVLADEVSLSNGRNPVTKSAPPALKDQKEISEPTVPGESDHNVQAQAIPDAPPSCSFNDAEALLEEPVDESTVSKEPVITTYASRRRTESVRSRKHVLLIEKQADERSKTSSWLESYRFQKLYFPSNDSNITAGDVSRGSNHESSPRNKQTGDSLDVYGRDELEASSFASNGSIDHSSSRIARENISECVRYRSESCRLTGVCTTDIHQRIQCLESVVECVEGDMKLEKGLDVRNDFIKKKRKLNMKQATHETAESTSIQEHAAVFAKIACSTNQNIENVSVDSCERLSKEEGDEHLPLVKRARVRIGQASLFEEENRHGKEKLSTKAAVNFMEKQGNLYQAEETIANNAIVNVIEHTGPSVNNENDCCSDMESCVIKEALVNCSAEKDLRPIPDNSKLLRSVNNCFGCLPDVEGALPPSKRLHRALEAMSANAAEGHVCDSTVKTLTNGSCISSMSSSNVLTEAAGDGSEEPRVRSPGHWNSAFFSTSNTTLEAGTCSQPTESFKNPESCKYAMPFIADENQIEPCSEAGTVFTAIHAQSPNDTVHQHERGPASLECNHSLSDLFSAQNGDSAPQNIWLKDVRSESAAKELSNTCSDGYHEHPELKDIQSESPANANYSRDEVKSGKIELREVPSESPLKAHCTRNESSSEKINIRDVQLESPSKELGTLDHTRTSVDFTPTSQDTKPFSLFGTNALQDNEKDASDANNESSRSQMDDNGPENGMYKAAEDIKSDITQKEDYLYSSCMDGLNQKNRLHLELSPFSRVGKESPVLPSPRASSICHVSTSESANCVQNSGYSSPNTNSDQKKRTCSSVSDEEKFESATPRRPKYVDKGRDLEEAHVALSSFEGMLGSLERTKESIGRATRLAIDCGKYGLSAKVVEIIVRSLELESNLHRRVDLLFLVDSIAQCSRGLKGEVGGKYLPAIEAVLQRLLSGAAPPGSSALENRRQCLKVLRLWLERRIFPESVVRHLMRELDFHCDSSSADPYARRSERKERPLDDPVRDMEGMLVDEYGSNSTFQLPGFCMPHSIKIEDDETDSDGESFEAVTPEHNPDAPEEQNTASLTEKHTHILEAVDGELEMEDVAPPCPTEMTSSSGIAGDDTAGNINNQFEQHFHAPFSWPPSQDVPPLLSFLSPLPSHHPVANHSSLMTNYYASGDHFADGMDPNLRTNLHNMPDDSRQPGDYQPIEPRFNPSMSNGVNCHVPAPENGGIVRDRYCKSNNSFINYLGRPVHDNFQGTDGPDFHPKAHPRPPQPGASIQFSHDQGGQHVKPWRENPLPTYSHRFYSTRYADGRYDNRERFRPASYEQKESRRYPLQPCSGTRYCDESRGSYPPGRYSGSQRGRLLHRGWGYPPWGMHQRNYMPYRSPPEGSAPVMNRASSNWWPR